MNHHTSVAIARLGLDARVALAPTQNHPIGMKAGFFLIVAIFLVVLGITMAVGHLRERGRQRRAQADIQGLRRNTSPPKR